MSLTEKEKMLAELPHFPNDADLSKIRQQVKQMLFQLNYQLAPADSQRKLLLERLLGKCGDNLHINSPFFCDYGFNIEVGDNFFANNQCTILDSGKVSIGDNVMFAPNVSLYTVGHPLHYQQRNQGYEQAKAIIIKDNVWIGGSCVILGGVTIGENSVIGAGSVVTKSIPANSLAFGNPCRVIREINDQDRKQYQQLLDSTV
ncbi:sugar O-acetyltransferase [Gallibacterium anatis]|uniref:sugar O-acetyltransferase n=1 Tax=Gallibacterium anatis TaxID=750 RepID=UPI000B9FE06E|nr:sugar O-acetyltransferase [Gallibacterium anatis]OZN50283.1 galactoside O-acetyltransferase [Gallibacterium anatis]